MLLLRFRLTSPKQRSLTEMVEKALAPFSHFAAGQPLGITQEPAHIRLGLHGTTTPQCIRLVTHRPGIDRLPHMAVALIVMQRRQRSIDGNLMEVRSAQSNELSVRI
jgi:hypothetical protein